MARYPRAVRSARIKCVSCNAPVVETIDGDYACVDCGDSPISSTDSTDAEGSASSNGAEVATDGTGADRAANRDVTGRDQEAAPGSSDEGLADGD